MFYEKFMDIEEVKENQAQSQNPSLESVSNTGTDSSEISIKVLNCGESILNEYYKPNNIKITGISLNRIFGFEEDTPFDGLAPDDVSLDDAETNDGNTSGGSPFDNLTDEQNIALDTGDDMFGDVGVGGDDQQKQPGNQIEISRQELLQASYDLPASIRKMFPRRLLELKEVIQHNITLVEKLSGYINDDDDIVNSFTASYLSQIKLIDDYLNVITERTYDDIFKFYVKVHTQCMKIRESYQIIIDELFNNEKSKKG